MAHRYDSLDVKLEFQDSVSQTYDSLLLEGYIDHIEWHHLPVRREEDALVLRERIEETL